MKKRTYPVFLSAVALTLVQGCIVVDDGNYGGGNQSNCRGSHNLRVVDLDMSPDPIRDDQNVNRFRVQLRADQSGECDTSITIREGGRIIARQESSHLRPGLNTVTLIPRGNYRFDKDDRCFDVLADIEKSQQRVDAERQFCAKQSGRGLWTMK